MKEYIPGETKEQRKQRKAREKAGLSTVEESTPVIEDINKKRYVVCLKWGDKYDATYVNTLYNMVQRNLTLEHEFVCFTENAEDINPEITIKNLPIISGLKGWWYKPMFFNPGLGLNGTILFLDLDMIIFRNIDKLFEYNPGSFCIIRDFNRYAIRGYDKFNSSVFRLDTGSQSQVYHDFIKNPNQYVRRFHGDQDWIRYSVRNDFCYWPEEWIQSYKWEMRGKPKMIIEKNGKRNFQTPGDPKINFNTSIAVFHGEPNPHNCIDPWCKENWW